ncbi:DUF86 domain-containing protein [Ottowia beijingensis]|uniref:HepT-like ribonuclease domain-containing protein n=1 Tax=Ottowia beijingensis TaxID=1207057 RepID=UPI002FD8A0AF
MPWREISGFRNILAHNYLGAIDPQTVARVVAHDLPPLQAAIQFLLSLPQE